MVAKAFTVARLAHQGQKDKAGAPYILHPVRVAIACKGSVRKTVALLHDVIEDTDITEKDLLDKGFPEEVVTAVVRLTCGDKEGFEEYLQRISQDPIALDVKIEDTAHNLRKSEHYAKAIPSDAEKAKMERRAVKYRKRLKRLLEARTALIAGPHAPTGTGQEKQS